MSGTRFDPSCSHPLARTFVGTPEGAPAFLQEDGQSWTVSRLLSLAGDVSRTIPGGAPSAVAVRSRSAAFVVAALLALWKRGAYPVLLDPALTEERATLARLDRDTPILMPSWTLPPAGPGGTGDAGADRLRRLVVDPSGGTPSEAVFPEANAISVAFCTSGSTGEPKIVEKRDRQMVAQFQVEPAWLGLSGPVTTVSLVPVHHILGYIYGLHMPAGTGGRVTFAHGASPQVWVDTVRRVRPSLVVGVPLHYRLMNQILDAPLPKALYLSSGGPLPTEVGTAFEERAGSPIVQVYGSTEAGGIATRTGEEPWRPLPGLEWQAAGDTGRLRIRSPWQWDPSAWQPLDDVVEPAGAGFELLGRADSVVKVGGRRLSLIEIVRAALTCERIEQAHAVTYARYGELAVALFVVPAREATAPPPTEAAIRSALASRLAAFKVPRTIRLLDELPLCGIGKIDEGALRALVTAPGA